MNEAQAVHQKCIKFIENLEATKTIE
jgi:hypothetical protein